MNVIKSYIVTNAASATPSTGGGLTSFTVGNLSPLFTASLGADPLVNPALTFTAVNQNANLFYAGPATGVAAAPTFRALVAADIPSGSTNYWKTAGTTTTSGDVVINSGTGVSSISLLDRNNYTGIVVVNDVAGESAVGVVAGSVGLGSPVLTFLLDVTGSQGSGLGAKFIDGRGSPEGIQYGAAGYVTTDRSLTDRGYVLGAKTYTGQQTFSLTSLYANNTGIDVITTGGSDILNIGTSNADVINIGFSGSTINITGTLAYQNVTNLQVTDKLFTVNKGGGVGSGVSSGFEIEENNVITGYFATNGTRDGWDFKAPAITGVANLSLASLTGNHTYTLPDANGTFAVSASGNIALSAAGDITFTGILGPANGGTGVANNAASTLTISGNFATTFTVTGVTSVTLPTSGTLVNSTEAYLTASGGTATGPNTFTGTTTNIFKYVFNGLGVTQTNGVGHWLSNTTAAAAGVQQISPSTIWEGQGWKTNATAGSQSVMWIADVLPIQGAANPTATWRLGHSINGSAITNRLTIGSGATTVNIIGNGTSTGMTFRTQNSSGTDRLSITDAGAFMITSAVVNPIGFTPAFTANADLNYVMSLHGSATLRSTANDQLNTLRIATGITTGSTGQIIVGVENIQTYTVNHTGATVIGFDHNPTLAGSQTPTNLALRAVTGSVLIGGTTLTTSAILDLQSTTLAFIPPRMTGTQRDNIASPSFGMVVYNTTTNKLNVYTTAWEQITSA